MRCSLCFIHPVSSNPLFGRICIRACSPLWTADLCEDVYALDYVCTHSRLSKILAVSATVLAKSRHHTRSASQ